MILLYGIPMSIEHSFIELYILLFLVSITFLENVTIPIFLTAFFLVAVGLSTSSLYLKLVLFALLLDSFFCNETLLILNKSTTSSMFLYSIPVDISITLGQILPNLISTFPYDFL